jgi:hypothetical protein
MLKAMGVKPGVPDVVACFQGKFYALELKADGGRLSTEQRNVLDALRRAGAIVAVATGLDEALRTLESWGLLRPACGAPRAPSPPLKLEPEVARRLLGPASFASGLRESGD